MREAVYDGTFSTPKTAAGVRQIPLSGAAVKLTLDWRARVKHTEPESLMFATWSGKPISPNNVLRRWIVPACETLGLKRVSWLTLRRTYSSWAHEKGVPGKVIAQLMGHAKVDTTLNVYTQVVDGSLRRAADTVGSELFTIVHKPEATTLGHPPKAAARAERGIKHGRAIEAVQCACREARARRAKRGQEERAKSS